MVLVNYPCGLLMKFVSRGYRDSWKERNLDVFIKAAGYDLFFESLRLIGVKKAQPDWNFFYDKKLLVSCQIG